MAYPGITPAEIAKAVEQVTGNAEIDLLQIEILPTVPHLTADVKAHRAADGEWFQGRIKLAAAVSGEAKKK